MKARRHAKILELISQYDIDTQEELLRRLRDTGFEVTQATVSRDIKELRLVKTLSTDGQYRYSTGKEDNRDISSKFYSLLQDSATSINCTGNLVVIKSVSGMAQAICAAMDTMHWEAVVGTLAGDDTIFVAVRSEHAAQQFAAELTRMMG
ncbi:MULTISPECIES: arginine repressor [Caproicibacterium]|jgi:transcriptional regulator of arginine metabolism|uniref:Arginine repressor n=1 Tax=Caproicibacterium lactatifermentans TaxID=2666138 RepID=A0A859DP23_9FIRM|nr:arginine repressor [Caproicibacterium lactatifermentans]ARP50494.1 arginine repressor [Ruminococcaceae bacterium CPB6]MDD4808350.1 arginine repressor [Oscillospiraceae bacterium]QKN23787.1 arginine repressor [Caproicibacterium lactatifermentans]QKO29577.1 arginine repressor [Caproicibacterium lactatifermentans]